MDEILKVDGHDKLTYVQLLVLIEQWKNGEWDLFLTIKDWLDVNYKSRKQHLDSLMIHVRFSLLTQAQLEAVKKMKMYSEGSWRGNVEVGQRFHSQPIHEKMMRPTSVRNKPQVVCFSDKDRSTMHTLEEDGHWKAIDVPTMPLFEHEVSAVLEFNNCLVIAEDDSDQTWHVFDASTFTWSKMQSMKKGRFDFVLVHDDRYLYALGGIEIDANESCDDKAIDTIERYDPGTNTWTTMTTRLPGPLCKHSACVCSGPFFSIYVAGGLEKPYYETAYLSAMNCFNPYEESATWHKKAPMLVAEESYVMREMEFGGKNPAIIIMCEELLIQYYDLKTDQWSYWKAWAHIDVDWQWHNNGTVLSDPTENTLYVLNICENFKDAEKEPDQGVCGKWPLSTFDDAVFGYPVDKFPLKSEYWEDFSEPDYFAAILAMPAPSKRMIPTHVPSEAVLETTPPSVHKATAKAKPSN